MAESIEINITEDGGIKKKILVPSTSDVVPVPDGECEGKKTI